MPPGDSRTIGFTPLLDLKNAPINWIHYQIFFTPVLGYFVPLYFLPTHALALGLPTYKSMWLLSIFGITNSLGRPLVGLMADRPWADCIKMYIGMVVLGGAATITCPLFPSMIWLSSYSVIYGLSAGNVYYSSTYGIGCSNASSSSNITTTSGSNDSKSGNICSNSSSSSISCNKTDHTSNNSNKDIYRILLES